MRSYVCIFALALFVSAILTPLVRWFAVRVGAVATPRARDSHSSAVPRLGGVAIAAACVAPLLVLPFIDSAVADKFRERPRLALGLLVGGVALVCLGVADDTRGLRARTKLAAQLAVAVFAYALGFRIEAVSVPLLGVCEMGVFALPVTALWIVGIINAVNLIDGLDGLAAGIIFLAALTNLVVAVVGGQVFVALVMSSIMGAMLGFLLYNSNPARIFMGDSGSYFLGYLLATASLTGALQKASTAVSLLVPMVALGVPIFDTLFSMVRRTLERRPLFTADRGHVHHRLLDMGLTHRRAVMVLYAVSIVFTASAIAIALGRSWAIGVALLSASVVLIALIRFVGYFEYVRLRKTARVRSYDHQTLALRPLVPRMAMEISAMQSEEQIWSKLVTLAEGAQLAALEVKLSSALESRTWAAEAGHRPPRNLVPARFPLDADGCFLEFGWISETERVSPECDILLQLVTDSVGLALASLSQTHVPVSAVAARIRAPHARAPAVRPASALR
jgi:UDP-GlcNAc:undecaprenyl-phosphate/decaprenyl-phosphate GlcNAc-1-phosphate transferase